MTRISDILSEAAAGGSFELGMLINIKRRDNDSVLQIVTKKKNLIQPLCWKKNYNGKNALKNLEKYQTMRQSNYYSKQIKQ